MLKGQIIGYAGKDAVVQQHGIENVINFSVCHTDRYTDAAGVKHEKATWVNCSWWKENTNVAQYIKKGTLLYVEGAIEAKNFKDRNGESKPYLNLRVVRVELLGGNKSDGSQQPTQAAAPANNDSGYKPVDTTVDDFSDLPF